MAIQGKTKLDPTQFAAVVGSMQDSLKQRWSQSIGQMSNQDLKNAASIMNAGPVPPGSDIEMLRDMLNEAIKDE